MKKKAFIILIWFIVINILINVCYYFIFENGFNIIMPQIAFKTRYFFRKTVDVTVDYKEFEKNNVVSKDNISIKLCNINYEKNSGELKLEFEFDTNNDYPLDYIGGVQRIYDDKKIFYHTLFGTSFYDTGNIKYLLYSENMYGVVDGSNRYNKKIYGELDDSNFNDEPGITYDNMNDDEPIYEELTLNLGKDYDITGQLYIDFIDVQYKTVDEFEYHKAFEPLGVLRFIINFQ